jgi:hypothetical protein
MSISVEIDTNSVEKYVKELDDNLERYIPYIIYTLAIMVAGDAKEYTVPVRTGRLQESIRVERKGETTYDVVAGGIEIRGKLVDYALYVEEGTRRFAGRFYMHSALQDVMVNFDTIVDEILKGGTPADEYESEVSVIT